MAEARKQLSRDELKGFKLSLEEFREKALDNADGKWTTMLEMCIRDRDNGRYISAKS